MLGKGGSGGLSGRVFAQGVQELVDAALMRRGSILVDLRMDEPGYIMTIAPCLLLKTLSPTSDRSLVPHSSSDDGFRARFLELHTTGHARQSSLDASMPAGNSCPLQGLQG